MWNKCVKILTWLIIIAISVLLVYYISYDSLYKVIALSVWSIILTVWVLKTPWPKVEEDDSS